jgi:hypothetical protein
MVLTIDSLMAASRLVRDIEAKSGPIYPLPFDGVRIIKDHNALAETTERLFPTSRHRSKRVRKKLMKRFGGEFRKVPAIFRIQGRIIAHPARYAELMLAFPIRSAPQTASPAESAS